MGFCTQCGNSIEADARFCGKCGAEIRREDIVNSPKPIQKQLSDSANKVTNRLQNISSNPNWKKQKYNKKVIGLIALALIIGFYMVSPNQLKEQEYEDLVIELLVKDEMATDNFSNEIAYYDIDTGFDAEWSEGYKQLIKPAKALEKDFKKLRKTLENVKPPEYFKYEHETLLKVFNTHENMASNLISYVESGDEKYMELFEEFENRADEYLDESIFVTEEYEEQIMQAYQNAKLD